MTPTFGPSTTAVLLACVRLHRPTVRDVAKAVGRSVTTTHGHLLRLRRAGLVAWEDGQQGTLRALVEPVEFGEAA